MKSYLLAILLITIPALIYAQPCTVNDATGCVCEDGSTDCLLLPNIKIAYDVLVDPSDNPEYSNVLRISVSTPNVGHGPLRVLATNNFVCGTDTLWNSNITVCPDGSTPSQLVKQRIYKKEGNVMTYIDRWAGTMTYHPTHNHSHFDEWGIYTLRIPDANEPDPLKWTIIGEGSKLGFCLMDYGSCEYYDGHCRDENDNILTTDAPNYGLGGGGYSCGTSNQGISAGWTDIYYYNLDGMFINIPNGTCNGDYMVVVQVDPKNSLLEENEDDNIMVAPITLTKQTNPASVTPTTSITINGPTTICDGEQTELSVPRTGTDYLWSNGETTSTITVTTAGTYTCQVITPCGIAISDVVLIEEGESCATNLLLVNDNFVVDEDAALSDNVLENDQYPDNANVSVSPILISSPTSGTVALNGDGTFTYTPNGNFNGVDIFVYEACMEGQPSSTVFNFTGQITSGSDDAEELTTGVVSNTSGDLDMMKDDDKLYNTIGLRYTNVDVPQGAVINSAYIRFTADESNNESTSLSIDAALAVNASPISTNVNGSLSNTPRTNASASWNNIPVWTASNTYNSTDISTVIQELVDQPTWQSGNAALLLIEGSGARTAATYESGALLAPQLFVDYNVIGEAGDPVCDAAVVYITIDPVNDAPVAMTDTITALAGERILYNIVENDTDIDGDGMGVSYIGAADVMGEFYIFPSGYASYTPDSTFVGTETVEYQVCDNGTPMLCDTSTLILISEENCVDIQLHTYLEGTYNSAIGEMSTELNSSRSILPGQTPTGSQDPTPAGQPYSAVPWNYTGEEGINFTDVDYTADMVDWVLISFREDVEKSTEVARTAALLHKDGAISFPDRCVLSAAAGLDSLYVVIEHRNHIGVMSPSLIAIDGYIFSHDFRVSDSYRDVTSYGQKLLTSGVWCMYAGDADQSDFPSFDVTGSDKSIWVDDNGVFGYYRVSDFNLDGDVNGEDKALWFQNNGISSRVPK